MIDDNNEEIEEIEEVEEQLQYCSKKQFDEKDLAYFLWEEMGNLKNWNECQRVAKKLMRKIKGIIRG